MPPDNTAEQALIRRARDGDGDALGELYSRYAPAIYRYFAFRVQDHATAEDLTGAVFLKAVEGLPRYVDRGWPLSAWLFRIAHDRLVDHRRKGDRRQTEVLEEYLEDGQGDSEVRAIQRTEISRLHELIADLTDEQRTVIQLRFIEGLNLEETVAIIGKSTGAVKALQHRALRHLARRMEH